MRIFKSISILLLLTFTFVTQANADSPASFFFHGSGYGHGVGLSQMGARSLALAGHTSEEILKYYYKDVEIEKLDDSKILRVNIGHLLASAKFSSSTKDSPLQIFQGDLGDQISTPLNTKADSITFSIIGSTVSSQVKI